MRKVELLQAIREFLETQAHRLTVGQIGDPMEYEGTPTTGFNITVHEEKESDDFEMPSGGPCFANLLMRYNNRQIVSVCAELEWEDGRVSGFITIQAPGHKEKKFEVAGDLNTAVRIDRTTIPTIAS